jgi:hypothetical protein
LWRFANGRTERSDEKVAHGFLVLGKFDETHHVEPKNLSLARTRKLECGAVREKEKKKGGRTGFHGLV